MRKSPKLERLIRQYRCLIIPRENDHGVFTVRYRYEWDADTSCEFYTLCEVAESLKEAFEYLVARAGFKPCGSMSITSYPYVLDMLTPVKPKDPSPEEVQIGFVNGLVETIRGQVLKAIVDGKVPAGWNGHELRCLLADRFEESARMSAIRKDPRGARARAYRNTIKTTTGLT